MWNSLATIRNWPQDGGAVAEVSATGSTPGTDPCQRTDLAKLGLFRGRCQGGRGVFVRAPRQRPRWVLNRVHRIPIHLGESMVVHAGAAVAHLLFVVEGRWN